MYSLCIHKFIPGGQGYWARLIGLTNGPNLYIFCELCLLQRLIISVNIYTDVSNIPDPPPPPSPSFRYDLMIYT